MRVLIDSPEGLLLVLAHDPAESGSRSVNEHQVARIQQTVLVVHNLVWRRWIMLGVRGHTRRGPNDPMWSHIVDDPGPPL